MYYWAQGCPAYMYNPSDHMPLNYWCLEEQRFIFTNNFILHMEQPILDASSSIWEFSRAFFSPDSSKQLNWFSKSFRITSDRSQITGFKGKRQHFNWHTICFFNIFCVWLPSHNQSHFKPSCCFSVWLVHCLHTLDTCKHTLQLTKSHNLFWYPS